MHLLLFILCNLVLAENVLQLIHKPRRDRLCLSALGLGGGSGGLSSSAGGGSTGGTGGGDTFGAVNISGVKGGSSGFIMPTWGWIAIIVVVPCGVILYWLFNRRKKK